MTVVGSAEVVVRAITSRVRSDIQRAFDEARPVIQKAGQQAGDDFAGAFRDRMQGQMGHAFDDALAPAQRAAEDAGRQAGGGFGENFAEQAGQRMSQAVNFDEVINSSRGAGSESGQGFGDSFEQEVSNVARSAASDIERELTGAGRRGGDGAGKGFLQSGFANAADDAAKHFNTLFATAQLLGPAIATIVAAISSLVSGLFALGSAASQAAGALAVIPGVMAAAAQAMGGLKLAFSGVGAAIKAGFKTQPITGAAEAASASADAVRAAQQRLTRAVQDGARAVQDAKERLSRAYQDAAIAARDSLQRVQSAEENLAQAQHESELAQRSLSDARKQAAQDLRDLQFAAEDAALGEKRAGLTLQEARQRLIEAQALPADSQERKEAELSFQEAELAYREAKARNQDTQKEAKKANKAGIDGSQAVIDAQNKIADAENKVRDAEIQVRDAREAEAKTALQNARSIEDAQKAVQDAYRNQARSIGDARAALQHAKAANDAATGSLSAYNKQLQQLVPSQRAFVKYIVSIHDQFKGLKQTVGASVFPALTAQIKTFMGGGGLTTLNTILKGTGQALADDINAIGNFVNSGETLRRLGIIGAANNKTISAAGPIFANLGSVATAVLTAINTKVGNNDSLMERFVGWVTELTKKLKQTFGGRDDIGRMAKSFQHAGDVAAQLGRIIGNLFTAVRILFHSSTTAGQSLLDSFEAATVKLDNLLKKASDSGQLQKFFAVAADNTRSIAHFLGLISQSFLALGGNANVGKAFDAFGPAAQKSIDAIGKALVDAGPALAEFGTNLLKLISDFTEAGSIRIFIKILNGVVVVLDKLFSNKYVKGALLILAPILAIGHALGLLVRVGGFVAKVIIGHFVAMGKGVNSVRGGIGRLQAGFEGFKTGGFSGAMAGLKKSSDTAKSALETQMNTDRAKIAVLKELQIQAEATGAALGTNLAGGAKAGAGPVQAAAAPASRVGAAAAGDAAALEAQSVAMKETQAAAVGATAAVDALAVGEEGAAVSTGFLAGAMDALGGPFGIILIALPFLIEGFKALYNHSETFRKGVDLVVGAVKIAASWLGEKLLPVLSAVGGFFQRVFNAVLPIVASILSNVLVPAFRDLWTIIKFLAPIVIDFGKIIFKLYAFYFKGLIKIITVVVKLLATIGGAFVKAGKAIVSGVGKAISFVVNFIKQHWVEILVGLFVGPFALVALEIFKHFDAIKGAVSSGITAIVNFFKGLPGRIVSTVGNIFGWILDQERDGLVAIGNFVGNLVKAFAGLPGKLGQAAGNLFFWLLNQEQHVAAVLHNFVFKTVPGYFKNLGKNIGKTTGDIFFWLRDKLKAAGKWVVDTTTSIVKTFGTLPVRLFKANLHMMDWLLDKLKQGLKWVGDKLGDIVKLFGDLGSRLGRAAGNLFGWFRDRLRDLGQWERDKFDDLINIIKNMPGRIAHAARGMFDGIKEAFKDSINFIIDAWNGLSFSLPSAHIFGKTIGGFTLSTPDIPRLAAGGTVQATDGGVLALLAEAGKSERVQPLDSNGLSAGDKAILAALQKLANAKGSLVFAPQITAHGQDTPRETAREILLAQRRALLDVSFAGMG